MRSVRLLTFAVLFVLLSDLTGMAQQPALNLPKAFGGWVLSGAAVAPEFSPQQQALLHEFRLQSAVTGHYEQKGRNLELTVYSFPDVTDAFGAFTFAHPANVVAEKIGDGAVSTDNEVVFFHRNMVVDAKIDRMNAMTLSQMRELNAAIPVLRDAGNMPIVQKYLPEQGYVEGSLRYIIGPVGLSQSGVTLSEDQVNFGASPELVVAHYSAAAPPATLTLISYPTPQIAAGQMQKIQASWVNGSAPGNQIKRTYSFLAMTSGTISPDDAKTLLASVNYDANVTWNEPTKMTPRDNPFGLIWNIVVLCAILIGFMLLIGFFFGGFRILYFRLYPAKAQLHEEQRQLIRLNLNS